MRLPTLPKEGGIVAHIILQRHAISVQQMVHELMPQHILVGLAITLPHGIRVDPHMLSAQADDPHGAIEVLKRHNRAGRDHAHALLGLPIELLDLGERHMHIARRLQHQTRRAHLN